MPPSDPDILIVGGGAAGLTAAIFAARVAVPLSKRVVVLESARRPGAKILVSGGGRCNVTNTRVTPRDFCGGPQPTIRKVLAEFNERRTLEWFAELGVDLKLEPDGKYFPESDSARTVLDALLRGGAEAGAELALGSRVDGIACSPKGFLVRVAGLDGSHSEYLATRLIIASGGRALPKSGSDGAVMEMIGRLGHTIIPTTPALAPLLLRPGVQLGGRFAELRGIVIEGRLRLLDSDRLVAQSDGPVLFTHFGLSGPAAMNFSRHWLRACHDHPEKPHRVTLGLSQFNDPHAAEEWIIAYAREHPRQHVATMLATLMPERLAQAMTVECGAEGYSGSLSHLARTARHDLAQLLASMPIEVTGTRGYSHAEATAGGIDLREVDVRTMESRVVAGMHLCGEILDVDGRIGGFNFQWAWSSGYLAGRGAAAAI